MRILVVADVENKGIWDFFDREKMKGIDLVISCGDLDSDYLQFLVTMLNCPLIYVRGNHDSGYDERPPEGCMSIDDRIYDIGGLRILGLGGSMRYNMGSDMYTEREMRRRIRRVTPQIMLTGGFDILVTHAPAAGYGDLEDLPHRGFACFNDILNKWKPKYMLHGHVHKDYGGFVRERTHESGTKIINAWDQYLLEVKDDEHPPVGKTGSVLYDLYTAMRNRK